jgi:Flp pilus assembly protein TadD
MSFLNKLKSYKSNIFTFLLLFFCLVKSYKGIAQNTEVQDTVLKSYVIQNGENLYTIAFKFNVSKELICKVNNAKTFNDLKLITGKRIFIPTLVKRKIVVKNILDQKNSIDTSYTLTYEKQDSIFFYNKRKAYIEDSVFLYVVMMDKKKDSIELYNKLNPIIQENITENIVENTPNEINKNSKPIKEKKEPINKSENKNNSTNITNKTETNKSTKVSIEKIEVKIDDVLQDSTIYITQDKKVKNNIRVIMPDTSFLKESTLDNNFTNNIIEDEVIYEVSIKNNITDPEIDLTQDKKVITKINIDSIDTSKNEIKDSSVTRLETIDTIEGVKKEDSISNQLIALENVYQNFNEIKEENKNSISEDPKIETKTIENNSDIQVVTNDTKNTEAVITSNYDIDNTIKDNDINPISASKNKKQKKSRNTNSLSINKPSFELSTIDVVGTRKNKQYRIGEVVSEADKQKSSFYLARAMKAIDAKEYANAEGFLNKAIELNPNYTEAYMLHADLFYTINDFTKAIKEYDKAIMTNKNMISAYYNRGANHMKLNELNKSLNDFNTAIKLDPEYILAIGGRATIFLLKKDYTSAIKDYNKILELNKFFNPAYKARAIAKMETGDLKGAIEDCSKFLEAEPNDAYMVYQRGMARMKDGDIYNSCLDLLKSSELGYTEASKAMKKFCN